MKSEPDRRIAVLGVDAAWTAKNPSGYALVERYDRRWRLRAAAPNLAAFALKCGCGVAGQGMIDALDCVSHVLDGRLPELIAVDMPMSRKDIVGRRASDIDVSKRFGAAKCATHSPSERRPGKVSDEFRKACEARGYALFTIGSQRPVLALAEVYPHPALLRLTGAVERLPYKVGKTRTYWPTASRDERLQCVTKSLRAIVGALESVIAGVSEEARPTSAAVAGFSALKPAEDMIDAIVSAWVGTTILDGGAEPIGDADSAIWVPYPLETFAALAGVA